MSGYEINNAAFGPLFFLVVSVTWQHGTFWMQGAYYLYYQKRVFRKNTVTTLLPYYRTTLFIDY